MSDNNPTEPAPLNMAELKMRLMYGDPQGPAGQADLIRELIGHPTAAIPLIPIVVSQYRAGRLSGVPDSYLVELYLKINDSSLLDSVREKTGFRSLSMHEKSLLFEAGVTDLEDELLQFLWHSWGKSDEPQRGSVVQALGKRGGSKALEMLQTIRGTLDAQNAERRAKVRYQDDHDEAGFIGGLELKANESFLGKVRNAISELTSRKSGEPQ